MFLLCSEQQYREVKHFIFPLNGARGIVSLTNYCQLIKKLTYKKVQIEQINEDKQLSDISLLLYYLPLDLSTRL